MKQTEERFLSLIFCLFVLCSCTTIHFRSSGTTSVPIGVKEGHKDKDEVIKKKYFFLWGAVPKSHIVYVDREIVDRGYFSGANVIISEYQTFWDWFFSMLSFGIYIPKTYSIEFNGYRREIGI